jgi:CheY-like chemotaxis protein
MPTKKSENEGKRKSSAPEHKAKPPDPPLLEITVQKGPEPQHDASTEAAASKTAEKIFHPTTVANDPPQQPLNGAEDLLYHALQQLQIIHNETKRENAEKVIIELPTFTKIANTLQQAWEQVKAAQCTTPTATEDSPVLSTLKEIQASITILEQKYESIETKVTEAPKTYAEMIKSTSIPPKPKDKKIELRTQRRDQLEAIRKRRDQHSITLSTKTVPASMQEKITKMSGIDIAEQCQKAINTVMPSSQPHMIRGICKLSMAIRIQFDTEEHMELVQTYAKTPGIDWNKAFNTTGIELHEPRYGIVVHGVPLMDLNTDDMTNIDIIKQLEQENNTPAGTVVGITTLRRRNKQPNKKPQLHHSVVIFFNKHHEANKAITNGYCINYIIHAAECFTPQFQIQQCYNCCDYGHQVTHCK